MTRLVKELRDGGLGRQVRILSVMGLRAQESKMRAKLPGLRNDPRATNGRRHVDVWLPIHAMTLDEVWADIHASGVRYHWAYDEGMPRLSCRFCVLASRSALVRAAQLDPAGAKRRVDLEQRMGHTFQNGTSMAQIVAEAEAATARGIKVVPANWHG